jgi:hypothetical protein
MDTQAVDTSTNLSVDMSTGSRPSFMKKSSIQRNNPKVNLTGNKIGSKINKPDIKKPNINKPIKEVKIDNTEETTSCYSGSPGFIVCIIILFIMIITSFILTKYSINDGDTSKNYVLILLWVHLITLLIGFLTLVLRQKIITIVLFVVQYLCILAAQIIHRINGNVVNQQMSIAAFIGNGLTMLFGIIIALKLD